MNPSDSSPPPPQPPPPPPPSSSSTSSSAFGTIFTSTENSLASSSSGESSGGSTEIPAAAIPEPEPEVISRCVRRQGRVSWGYTSVIGRRSEMEDAVAVVPGFMTCTCHHVGGCTSAGLERAVGGVSPVHFFGVYDGHGGSEVANYCAQRMHGIITEEWNQEGHDGHEWHRKWEETFCSSFTRADDLVITEGGASEIVGSTAVVAVVSGCQIILSNCGDSRAVLCKRTQVTPNGPKTIQTVPLSIDHKPDREDELSRIEGVGGRVFMWNGARVSGVLAMSRAIGDRYMRPYVIPVPEITFTTRSEEDECLILASDGLWDVMTNEEVGKVASNLLRKMRRSDVAGDISPAQVVADALTELAMGRYSSDNISVIVVDLKSTRRHQGCLDDRFLVLEDLEEHQPDFVESIMSKYIPSAADYIQKLQEILDSNPMNLAEFERLILKLKGASASVGTAKLTAAVDELLAVFHRNRTDINRLGVALGKVRSEHLAMKSALDPYIEILAQLRGEAPPVDGSDSNEDE